MPEPRAQGPQRGVGRQASSQARQVAQDLARMDVALGPAEVALGNIIGIIAGMAVGAIPAVIFRSGGLLPLGVLLGAIGGWLAFRLIRGRLTIRGWRLGGCGVLVVGILTICFACNLLAAVTGVQNRRAGLEIFRRQNEMGIAIPPAAERLLEQSSNTTGLQFPLVGVIVLGLVLVLLLLLIVGRRKGWI